MMSLKSFPLKVCHCEKQFKISTFSNYFFTVIDWDVESQQEGNTELNQWEDNWEDDDQIEDDFSVQLR